MVCDFGLNFFFGDSLLDNISWPLSQPLQLLLGFVSFLHYSLVLLFYARTWYTFSDNGASEFVTNNVTRIYILIMLITFICYMTLGLYFSLQMNAYFDLFTNIVLTISLGLLIIAAFYYIGGVAFRVIELNFDEETFIIIKKTRTTAIVFLFLYIAVIILSILVICNIKFVVDNAIFLSPNAYNSLCHPHLGRLMLLDVIPLLCTAYTFYPTRPISSKIHLKEVVAYEPIPAASPQKTNAT